MEVTYLDAFGNRWGLKISGVHGMETGGYLKNNAVHTWMPEIPFKVVGEKIIINPHLDPKHA